MKTIITLIFLISSAAVASTLELKSGTVKYTVTHPMHTVEGVSNQTRGKLVCEKPQACTFLLAVPVKSFDSGSSNRDQHMQEITRAALNPMVVMKGTLAMPSAESQLAQNVEISFAGNTKTFEKLPVRVSPVDGGWRAQGSWVFKFSDFAIERPSLLKVPVKDEIRIEFDQTWK